MSNDPKNKAQSDPLIIEGLEKSYLSIPHQRPRDSGDPAPLNEGTVIPMPSSAQLPEEP